MAEATNSWAAIREGTNDVERLIGQKQYNLAMVKARQTLEIMVRTLAENNGIQYTDMATVIDQLYNSGVITRTTADHYHKIRMIGNKAAHEGDENPSGANTAYHLLSQELYTFAKGYSPNSTTRNRGSQSRSTGQRNEEERISRTSHRTSKKSKGKVTPEHIFIIMIPILVILLIIGIVSLVKKEPEEPVETEPELQITVETTAPETETLPPETEPETITFYTVIPEVLNVRSEPNTDCAKLGQVHEGETLNYLADVDDEWAMIQYNETEGYISKQYVNVQTMDLATYEAEAAAAAEAAAGEAEAAE